MAGTPCTRHPPPGVNNNNNVNNNEAWSVPACLPPALHAAVPPVVDLDGKLYKLVDKLEPMIKNGVPSLKGCKKIVVKGPSLAVA